MERPCDCCDVRTRTDCLVRTELLAKGRWVCPACSDQLTYEDHVFQREFDWEQYDKASDPCECEACERHLERVHREWVRDRQARLAAEQGPVGAGHIEF